ncbi:unnamed protein product [Lactuca virosa]|uniref:DNA-directed RNA polymerase n=1 Tax=Lactuca virosa TaxID=75947 RepID=A0AAU9NE34_9ASTR|nr:unnamed protein product [Lactuca virosa]
MSWLGDCAKVIAVKNNPLQWTTPFGLPVVQPYRKLGRHLVISFSISNCQIKTSLQVLTLQRETDKLHSKLFDAVLHSYRMCDSTPRVFDALFKIYAQMKQFRNATDTFCRMKEYRFLPTIESCNMYMSSLLSINRVDITLPFYNQM